MKYILLSLLLLSVSCKQKEQHTNTETPTTTEEQVVEQRPRYFLSSETGLPVGIIVGGETIENGQNNNYISIQDETGKITVVKNIDWQLWSGLKKGDIIK